MRSLNTKAVTTSTPTKNCPRGKNQSAPALTPTVPTIVTWKSVDGGRTFEAIRGAPGGDDYQRAWFNPANPDIIALTSDQGAVITLTKSMAAELAPKSIRVNAINPVMGETGMLERFMGSADTPENRAKFLAGIPLGRLSRPHDIANAAMFLADPASSFITGVALEVDGGRCI